MDTNSTQVKRSFWHRALHLYVDGFRNLSRTSKALWIIILVKLFIMFAVLRLFFFPNIVNQQGDKEQRATFVMEQITQPKNLD